MQDDTAASGQANTARTGGMENLLGKLGWPGASVILSLVTAIVLLAWPAHQSLQDIVIFIGGVGAAYVAWNTAMQRKAQDEMKVQQAEIKVQVNGNNDALRAQVAHALAVIAQQAEQNGRLQTQMAALLPAGSALPAALADLSHPSPLDALMALSLPVSGAGTGAVALPTGVAQPVA